jgi:small-conductance mechanosensitive channel
MRYFHRFLSLACCLCLLVLTAPAQGLSINVDAAAPDKTTPAATVTYMNRPVAVLRATLAGTPPTARAERAERRLEEVKKRDLRAPLRQVPVTIGNQSGIGLQLGDVLLFTLLPEDADPETPQTVPDMAAAAQQALEASLAAYRAQHDPGVLLSGAVHTLLALAILTAVVWLLWHVRSLLLALFQRRILPRLANNAAWLGYVVQVVERVLQIAIAFFCLGLGYLWLVYSLQQFPLSQPLGAQLWQFLWDLLGRIGAGFVTTLPDVVTLAVVFLITRTIVQSLHALFQAVHDGRMALPGLHRETLGATRRIVTGAVWALGFTFAYPYIPGSQSDVFKGLSVLFGFTLTLGSAGIVSQLMAGMTLIYSRALRRGDLVQIGDSIGIVEEIGTLSTKLIDMYQQEITIPNAVLVSNQIRNLSRGGEGPGLVASTTVTIGYDTPWRQVHALLLNAAQATPGIKTDPAPQILQRALDDFYVCYEFMVTLSDPMMRPQTLSALHGNILDEFNSHDVQIMSPHFVEQPEDALVIDKIDWVKAPAKKEGLL